MPANIKKIYASNFLVGLVFWYAIEKLFMQSIGIDAVGIGISAAFLLGFNLVADIPSGMLADRWSRKGMLFVAVIAMALASVVLASSHGLGLYLVGYILYGVYVVSTSGTYQALMYDSLHEHGRSAEYSKIMGRAYALFLTGAGVANIASGFLAQPAGYQFVFYLSIIPCLVNLIVIATIQEPTFHKAEQKEKLLVQMKEVVHMISGIPLLRGLAIIMTAFSVIELFKGDFGQLYMLRYVSSTEVIGLLWAAYAFTWALGSVLAHRLKRHLSILVYLTTLPVVTMALLDSWIVLILFMVQAVAAAALFNQIETRIQEATPSAVRASVLSILSAFGRGVGVPASIMIGWLIRSYGVLSALYAVAVVAACGCVYWLFLRRRVDVKMTA